MRIIIIAILSFLLVLPTCSLHACGEPVIQKQYEYTVEYEDNDDYIYLAGAVKLEQGNKIKIEKDKEDKDKKPKKKDFVTLEREGSSISAETDNATLFADSSNEHDCKITQDEETGKYNGTIIIDENDGSDCLIVKLSNVFLLTFYNNRVEIFFIAVFLLVIRLLCYENKYNK